MDTQVPKVDLDEVTLVVVVVTNSSRFTRSALVLEKVAMHGLFMSSDCNSHRLLTEEDKYECS